MSVSIYIYIYTYVVDILDVEVVGKRESLKTINNIDPTVEMGTPTRRVCLSHSAGASTVTITRLALDKMCVY